jgi:hypothetical protein
LRKWEDLPEYEFLPVNPAEESPERMKELDVIELPPVMHTSPVEVAYT